MIYLMKIKHKNSFDDGMESSVYENAGRNSKKKIVTTGIQDINYIEVVNGIKTGDEVVTGPTVLSAKN